MDLLETKKVIIGDKEFPIKITIRAMIEFEKITGKSITNFEGTENLIQFFYVTAKAGAKSENKEFKYTYEGFLDLIDENYIDFMNNFSQAIIESGGDEKKQKPKS